MNAAAIEQQVPKETVQRMLRAVMQEHSKHGFWPKDF